MKTVTNDFKTAITQPRRITGKIIIDDTELSAEQINNITRTFNVGLFKTLMKTLVLDTNNPIEINKTVNPQFGLFVNNNFEYVSLDNFKIISSEKNEDTLSYETKAYDKIIESMIDYDLSVSYPISVRDYWIAIFNRLGWATSGIPETFINSTKMINQDVHSGIGYTFRDVLDELCTISCAFLFEKNGVPTISYPIETSTLIDESYMKSQNIKIKEKVFFNSLVFSRVEGSDNIYRKDDINIEENGLHEFKIVDNQLLSTNDRVDFIDEMWNYLQTFEYYSFDIDTNGITFLEPIDRFSLKIGTIEYSTILLNDELQIGDGVSETIYNEEFEETSTEYKYADKTDKKINQTYLIVDKQNQKIESVISQTDEQNQKIAKVTQTVEELNSKISDIADITVSAEDTDAQVELNEINQSEPIRLVVRPIGENISYLYPSENLYPSEDLFMKIRTIRFHNNTTNEDFDYELPDDLLYYDENNYDEFILDYDGQSCVINKKVEYNADGTTYVLDTPTTIEYDFPKIVLTEGDYTVSILSYNNGYIFARLMAKNIYTTQFYTKSEVDSQISQTAETINLTVTKKLSNYSTTDEMNSAIEISASNITSNVSKTYATKTELTETETTLNSKIEQTEKSINLEVEKKMNGDDFTGANILLEINNDKSEAQINADKISLAGKEINLTGDNTTITSNNFKVDKNGNMTCSNATFTNGNIDTPNCKIDANGNVKITDTGQSGDTNLSLLSGEGESWQYENMIRSDGIFLYYGLDPINDGSYIILSTNGVGRPTISLDSTKNNQYGHTQIGDDLVYLNDGTNTTMVRAAGIETPTVTQTSLESEKKNFEKFENGLDVVNNVDIYKYHLKGQDDTDKKHIGFVIGDNYNYREEITSQSNNGVDLYSMISVAWQSIKELNKKIEQLENHIKELESDK